MDKNSTGIRINLPDLDDAANQEIVSDNIRAMGSMIFAAMLDELKAFEVVDKLVELSLSGQLPIGSADIGRDVREYYRHECDRLSARERRHFYAPAIGIVGGEPTAPVDREFYDLWVRFVSTVTDYVRQSRVDHFLPKNPPASVSLQQLREAARILALNLSKHGHAAQGAKCELEEQINFMVKLLSDPEITSAYGARDMWQVIDQVVANHLGGARNTSRYRTLAHCGMIITAWLANKAPKILADRGPLIDAREAHNPPSEPGVTPTDPDLVDACELWLRTH